MGDMVGSGHRRLESISGRWEGKRNHMHCDGVRSFNLGLGAYHQPCILTGNRRLSQ
jgi:hypothetical protein